jgi:uncharacterized membrane protein required for colicin V production
MTWLDWIVVAMLVYFVIQGLVKGAAVSVMSAVAIVIAYVGAAIGLATIGAAVANWSLMPQGLTMEWRRTVAFTGTFILFYVVLLLLMSILPGGKRPSLQAQVLGIVFGAIKAVIAAMALVGILLASPLSEAVAKDTDRSPMVRYVADLQKASIRQLVGVSPIPFPPIGPDAKF